MILLLCSLLAVKRGKSDLVFFYVERPRFFLSVLRHCRFVFEKNTSDPPILLYYYNDI